MKVIHPGDPRRLEGGIKTSISHQRRILEHRDITYCTSFEEDADILHLNILSPRDLVYLVRAKRHGIPVVAHTHEIGENFAESFRFSTYLSPVVRRYVDVFYRRADLLIAPTPYAERVMEDRVDTDIEVVPTGIDPERLSGVEDREVERPENFHVVNLSIVFRRKGVEEFVGVAERMPDTEFTWYGRKFNRFILESGIRSAVKNAPENASFPGYIGDARDAFASADAFLFPTRSETQGLSVFEAAYCGLPPVISDIPVYEDLFTHEKDCLKASSVEGFVEQLERLKEDEELRGEISENAEELGQQHTLDKVGERLMEAYETIQR